MVQVEQLVGYVCLCLRTIHFWAIYATTTATFSPCDRALYLDLDLWTRPRQH